MQRRTGRAVPAASNARAGSHLVANRLALGCADSHSDAHSHARARADCHPDTHRHTRAHANRHSDATASPAPAPAATPILTATPTPAPTATPTPTATPAPTATPSATPEPAPTPVPFPDPQPGRYTSISVGEGHTCAMTEDGAAVCWGGNRYGQAEAPPGRYAAISAGSAHTCAVTTDGEILCWGREIGGRPPPGRYKAVSTSGVHACALTEDGEAVCWGAQRDWNDFGQTDAPPGRYVAISVGHRSGEGAHPTNSCALTEDGEVVCWGYGAGERPYDKVPSGDRATRFAGPYADLASASGLGFCAVTTDGEAECRHFFDGALTPFEDTLQPGTSPPGGTSARYSAIAASWSHVCALTTEGQAICGTDVDSGHFFGTLTVMRRPIPFPAATSRSAWAAATRAHSPTLARWCAGTPSPTLSRLRTRRRGATSPSATGRTTPAP